MKNMFIQEAYAQNTGGAGGGGKSKSTASVKGEPGGTRTQKVGGTPRTTRTSNLNTRNR